ncbi:MAG: hypothetical protein A2073_01630 [Deltaproteobacteria bacterium GWC2_42_11]|nr:MAG: hypothetical protein A2073_01630 [Deltaproteobacteria bacterium GWC2_42_11]HBO84038.1 DUF58 domain-containing protein [Deltaproteobacteria bacterium]
MLSHEILENIKKLELRTRRLVDSFMVGEYFSVFKGSGMEFYEVREYNEGDDVRSIDWYTTARKGVPFVRTYIEERELPVIFLVDMSGSQDFGSGQRGKQDLSLEIVAFLGMIALKRNNPVGIIGFTDTVEIFHSIKKGRKNLLRILAALLSVRCKSRKTDISKGIDAMSMIAKKKGLVFLISDFIADGFELKLRALAKKHDVVPIVITDPIEADLPMRGFVELKDNEMGETMVIDAGSEGLRDWFHINAFKQRQERNRIFMDAGLDYIELRTDVPFARPIKDFFYRRQRARG